MLKQFLQMLGTKSPLKTMLSEFTQMLEKTEWMYDIAIQVLMHKRQPEEVRQTIYAKDKEVNEHQRSIRRKIVRHLTLQPGVDVPACLVLMSVVKDAERIGDFCKNILDLATMFDVTFDRGRYKTPLIELSEQVENLFSKTRKAFERSDEEMARSVMTGGIRINKQCEMLLKQLMVDNLPTKKAVGYTLMSRYFKRMSSHLTNIATSVVSSVDNLDYLDEPESSDDQA